MIFSKSTMELRKVQAAEKLVSQLKESEIVLVFAGEPILKPGGFDQTYEFIPHPDYFWLTGYRRAGGVCAFSQATGWLDFIRPLSLDETIWESSEPAPPGNDVRNLKDWMQNQKNASFVLLGKYPPHFQQVSDTNRYYILQEQFSQARRVKDNEEINLIKNLATLASQGYQKIAAILKAGLSERDIQIEYEAEVFRAGSHRMPYDSIVGIGTNSAILHASPSNRVAQKGEMVLIDAGADQYNYCVDITRMFPIDGVFSDQQSSIYKIVKSAQLACIEMCRPGVEWKDVHLKAAHIMAEGLQALNILKVDPQTALETEAISVFFPHGIGHMVGLQVRDVAGPYNPQPKSYAGARIRVDMQLQDHFLMTVEPGLYFIRALLESDRIRQKHKDHINWTEIDLWKNFGGVRIEDDILITKTGPENLTATVAKI